MTGSDIYLKLTDKIVHQMNSDRVAYATKTRSEITTLLRDISGQPRTKIGRSVGDAIEAALDHRGFRAFPHINELGTNGATRIIRRGTFADQILNAWLHPGTITDTALAELISKVKERDELLRVKRGARPFEVATESEVLADSK
jgi:hypothetical protein